MFVCYTSVICASELFEMSGSKRMIKKIKDSFWGINILGIPFRYSERIGEVSRNLKKEGVKYSLRDSIIAAMCLETKLPLLTSVKKKYKIYSEIFGLQLINKNLILQNNNPEIIYRKANIIKHEIR